MSALLVALIVTATFNGLDVATKVTSEQRHRNQAALLAAQSRSSSAASPRARSTKSSRAPTPTPANSAA